MSRAPKRPMCVARDGYRPCHAQSVVVLAGCVPLCSPHLELVRPEVGTIADMSRVEIVRVHTTSPAVVYYIGDPPTQRVKIGTSVNFRGRFIAVRDRFPEAVLLAVEPGHFDLEKLRHRQFADLRVVQRGQREWFRKTLELMEHVNAVRREYGDPAEYRADAVAPPAGDEINKEKGTQA